MLRTMASSAHAPREPQRPADEPDGLDELRRAHSAIVAEARAQVASGAAPELEALADRVRAAGRQLRPGASAARGAAIDAAERAALARLDRVTAVHRARLLLARQPAAMPPAARAPGSARSMLRTRPTITGNMDVRRAGDGETLTLSWDTATGVAEWEVRLSVRPDSRSDYAVRETQTLPASRTTVDLTLGELPQRVHLFGRGRDGRLVRRAIISGLSRESWNDRWQRRASAS